jgi:integration host factor subunit beta
VPTNIRFHEEFRPQSGENGIEASGPGGFLCANESRKGPAGTVSIVVDNRAVTENDGPGWGGEDAPGMTKSELIEAIAARAELTKARAELVVDCVFDALSDALKEGKGVEIRGFGSFTVRPYKPYAGRNPRTGNPVPVSAKRLPFFKVGKELKDLVDSSRNTSPLENGADDGDDDDDAEGGDDDE